MLGVLTAIHRRLMSARDLIIDSAPILARRRADPDATYGHRGVTLSEAPGSRRKHATGNKPISEPCSHPTLWPGRIERRGGGRFWPATGLGPHLALASVFA